MTWSLRESKRRMLGLDLYSACIFICLLVALIRYDEGVSSVIGLDDALAYST